MIRIFHNYARRAIVKRTLRLMCLVLVCALLCGSLSIGASAASGKQTQTNSIAIVFDNSFSMYKDGRKAWCQATYAIEVFAAMMNAGDTLQVYPMNPIEVSGQQYSSPF